MLNVMIRFILKQIWNERRSNAWLWAELLIVFVALWFIVDWSYVYIHTYYQPKGFNIDNTYKLTFNELTHQSANYIAADSKTSTDGEDFLAVIERLRHHPDILHVAVALNSSPYNGSNSHHSIRQDSVTINRLIRQVTPDFFNVFQYQNIDGSGSNSLAEALEPQTLILPSNVWQTRYPDGKGLLGQYFYMGNDSTTQFRITAVTEPVRYSDFNPAFNMKYFAFCLTENFLANRKGSEFTYFEVLIRTRPDAPSDFMDQLLRDAPQKYNVGNCYIQSIRSFDDIRHSFQLGDMNAMKKRGFIMLFLLVNIFLGIVGTFWYRTQQRRSELGLRMALGSSHAGSFMLLMGEGLLLLALAVVPALVVSYNIGHADISDAWQMEWGMARFIPAASITLLLMALMIVVGIWYPAYQAMKIEPAEALRDE